MHWRLGVLVSCVLLGTLPPTGLAHFDCEDEASWSDPTGTIHLWESASGTWVYMEKNLYPGLQTHACYDPYENLYTQDTLLYKL